MPLTPNEITSKDFKKAFRGYDVDDVDDFFDQVAEEYERIYKENITLKEKVQSIEDKVEYYSNLETTLNSTLVLAQSAADQARENSKVEAEHIIKEGKENAANIIKEAESKLLEIGRQHEMIKQEYAMYKARFRALLEAQIDILERSGLEESKTE